MFTITCMPWHSCNGIRAIGINAIAFVSHFSCHGICATTFVPTKFVQWHSHDYIHTLVFVPQHFCHGICVTAWMVQHSHLIFTALAPQHSHHRIRATTFMPMHSHHSICANSLSLRHSGHSIRAFVPRHLWHGIFATHSIFAMALATSHLHHNICTLAFFATAFMQWYSRT